MNSIASRFHVAFIGEYNQFIHDSQPSAMAVAAVIAIRKGRRGAGLKEEEDSNYVEDKLPPVELREEDMFLGLQTGG